MTRVWMLWHGGSSYAVPSVARDTEAFDSIERALWAFEARADRDPYYPCVESPEAHVFRSDPRESLSRQCDPYPDEVWTLGPRGGIRRERC